MLRSMRSEIKIKKNQTIKKKKKKKQTHITILAREIISSTPFVITVYQKKKYIQPSETNLPQ